MKFTAFGLEQGIIEGIEAMGFKDTTPIQEKTIPLILQGKDVIASAQTGTGKTAAFLIPVINSIISKKSNNKIKAMIIVPTRELALQIDQHLEGISYYTGISSIPVYGGRDGSSFVTEKQALISGTDIVVCTPGRIIAHLNMQYVDLSDLSCLILDEADRMLDMGFYDDIVKIISFLPKDRQNLMFSATMPKNIRDLARLILRNPEEINIALTRPVEKILQLAYMLYENQKLPLLKTVLMSEQLKSALIFCTTRSSAKNVSKELNKLGIDAEDIHSDLEQKEREQVLNKFKHRQIPVLVATDILSRGIDVENIDLVINYDVPADVEDYVHRIGRTARAENDGVAITLITEKDQHKFSEIEKLLNKTIHKAKLPLDLGEAPEYKPHERKRKVRRTYGRGRKNTRKKN